MKKVYKIVEYDLIGKILYTCKEETTIEAREAENSFDRLRFYDKGTNTEAFQSRLWKYSITPKDNALSPDEKLLPYFADVTEDLPTSVKLEPRTFENCQLMTEKHGGYLQFWHEKTQQILRIAINSNVYTPIGVKV